MPTIICVLNKESAFQFFPGILSGTQLGQLYEKQLRDDVVRLCLVLDLGAAEPVLRGVVDKAAAEDLMKLKEALEGRVGELMPGKCQLLGGQEKATAVESGFMI